MAFRELKGTGGGGFFKWPTVGTKFEGTFKALGEGSYQGRPTYHAVMERPDGTVVKVNTPTILRDKLSEAAPGMRLSIEYSGDKPGKAGNRPAKDFVVLVIGESAEPAAAPASGEFEELRAKLIAAKGQMGADAIISAAKAIAKDPAAQLAMLRQALGVA